MSQQATGTGINQITVSQSKSVEITINGQLAIQLTAPAFPRPPYPDGHKEIDLLKAANASIPFLGRDQFRDEFKDWCLNPSPISFRIVTGQGGAGKTRFAYELYAQIRNQPNWSAYFLEFFKNEAKEVDLWSEVKTDNALLIADYASDNARPLADLLRSLTKSRPQQDRRIRVLLLARTADWEQGWLSTLKSTRTGQEAHRFFHPQEPIKLPPFTASDSRQIFQAAVNEFAALTQKPAPAIPPPEAFNQPDVAERLADPLTLMMAAATATHQGSTAALTLNRTELAFKVADTLLAGRMTQSVPDHQALFLHMVAFATLSGGLTKDQALQSLRTESEATALGQVPDPQAFLQKLQAWLPPLEKDQSKNESDWIGPIQPDIVGEAFVLGEQGNARLQGSQSALLRAYQIRSTETVNSVLRTAQDFSFTETTPRLEPLAWIQHLIEIAESEDDLAKLIELADAMPQSSVILRPAALRISNQVSERARRLFSASDDTKVRALFARSLNNLALRQSDVGQRDPALQTAGEAVQLYRELAQQNRAAFLPDLAMSLNNLANRQSAVGQRDPALETAGEAEQLYRELAQQNRAAFLPALAMSLHNLAKMQSEVGRREPALQTAREAVQLYRDLAQQNRAAFLPALAMSLNNLAVQQSQVGQRDPALETAGEAVLLYRELAQQNRAAFLPDLATSLHNLAKMQSEVGQRDPALQTAGEAVQLRRELAQQNRAAFLPALASSLNNLANRQSEVGQRDPALETAREAVQLRRELAQQNRAAFLPALASSLNNLANIQSDVGQRDQALETAREAVQLRRELAQQNRAAFLPALASSLNNLANRQSDVGQRDPALETAHEAVLLYRELAQQNRAAFLPDLATSLNNLAKMQSEVGQRDPALQTAGEAEQLYLELAQQNRAAFLPDLAMSLHNLATMQSHVGQRDPALQTAGEAVQLYQELAQQNRAAFLPDLAMSLNNLATMQSHVGQRDPALETAGEAVQLRRELAQQNRAAFLPALAMSLNNLANRQSDVGQRHPALETAGEAVQLRRELAQQNRAAFLPALAMSLNNLAAMQSDVGQRDPALETAHEAVDLYGELAEQNRAAFSANLAKANWTLGDILIELDRHTEAAETFAEGLQILLPELRHYPDSYWELCFSLAQRYWKATEAANTDPDEALLTEFMQLLQPYLKQTSQSE